MTLSTLTLLAAIHGLQKHPYHRRCPQARVTEAVALVESDEAVGRHWSAQGLLALARRVCG